MLYDSTISFRNFISNGFFSACSDAANNNINEGTETLIFFRLIPSNCLNWKFTAMIALHFHPQPHIYTYISQYHKYEALFSRQDITPCVSAVDAANNM